MILQISSILKAYGMYSICSRVIIKYRLVVKGEKRPESAGTRVYINSAIIFKTEKKKNESYKFSFEK